MEVKQSIHALHVGSIWYIYIIHQMCRFLGNKGLHLMKDGNCFPARFKSSSTLETKVIFEV